jgi:hypothetical protein
VLILFLKHIALNPLNKDISWRMLKKSFLFAIIFYLGIIIFPESKPDCVSEISSARFELAKVDVASFSSLPVKGDFTNDQIPGQPSLIIKHNTNNASPKPNSDQTTLKEKRSGNLNRCPESAIFPFTAMFLGYRLNEIAYFAHLAFVKYSSWSGSSIRIRPPPIL